MFIDWSDDANLVVDAGPCVSTASRWADHTQAYRDGWRLQRSVADARRDLGRRDYTNVAE